MPLLDHFQDPLLRSRRWQSFYATWAVTLMEMLNRQLPAERYLAEVQVDVGTRAEAEVAEFDVSPQGEESSGADGGLPVPLVFPDDIEVQVFDWHRDARLVAAIELISPGNKDRPECRRAFAAKCLACLQRGVGLIVVDIVTERQANLHEELLQMLGQAEGHGLPPDADLYAVAYRPARRGEANLLDMWPVPLTVGQPLPLLPLALRGAFFVPVDLEATYTETRQRTRL